MTPVFAPVELERLAGLEHQGHIKRNDTRLMIENAGHTLEYLPLYSPDLNPIEPKWAKAKAIGRKTGQNVDELFANAF